MSTIRVCDICGKQVDLNTLDQAYLSIRFPKDTESDPQTTLKYHYDGMLHASYELCGECEKWVVDMLNDRVSRFAFPAKKADWIFPAY